MSVYPAVQQINGTFSDTFNVNSFQSATVQTNNVQTNSLNVNGRSNTNGIFDIGTSQLNTLEVTNSATLPSSSSLTSTPSVTDNSTNIATTAYVNQIANQILGASNLTINTIAMLDQAINTDPNFGSTITARLTSDETSKIYKQINLQMKQT